MTGEGLGGGWATGAGVAGPRPSSRELVVTTPLEPLFSKVAKKWLQLSHYPIIPGNPGGQLLGTALYR